MTALDQSILKAVAEIGRASIDRVFARVGSSITSVNAAAYYRGLYRSEYASKPPDGSRQQLDHGRRVMVGRRLCALTNLPRPWLRRVGQGVYELTDQSALRDSREKVRRKHHKDTTILRKEVLSLLERRGPLAISQVVESLGHLVSDEYVEIVATWIGRHNLSPAQRLIAARRETVYRALISAYRGKKIVKVSKGVYGPLRSEDAVDQATHLNEQRPDNCLHIARVSKGAHHEKSAV